MQGPALGTRDQAFRLRPTEVCNFDDSVFWDLQTRKDSISNLQEETFNM